MHPDGDGKPNLQSMESAARPTALTKTALIEKVSRALGASQREAGFIVESVLGSLVSALDRGDRIEIRGFGTFRTRLRRARGGRNRKTGARVEIPVKRIPFFKPSKELLNLIQKTQR